MSDEGQSLSNDIALHGYRGVRLASTEALRAEKAALESQNQALQEEVETLRELDRAHRDCHDLTKMRALQEENQRLLEQGELWQQALADEIRNSVALQERIEGAFRYLNKCQRDGREIGGRPLRNLLSPTQETDPE